MSRIKRVISMVLVVLMLTASNVPAFAATKPSAKLTKQSSYSLKRGKAVKFTFRLKSGSYTKKSGKYRSAFIIDNYYGTIDSSHWYDGITYAYSTKSKTETFKYQTTTSFPTGYYYIVYGTAYNKTGAKTAKAIVNNFSKWKIANADYSYFKLK